MIDLVWIPRLSLGPFVIGGSVVGAKAVLPFLRSDDLHVGFLDIESYVSIDGWLRIEARGDAIESISSESDFLYHGKNIVGMAVADIEDLLESKADMIDSTESVDDPVIVDFDGYGLQLVVNDGIVSSATCY
ncbi:MAG: hypothetical protein WBG81_05470 [Rhodanobacter sp.]|uniref:hypothetical protein n=1 Tax=Rhodanobacter sp. KK11 TaxID=3083255 RepID=UPI002965DD2D|nr:hypothetical protein [Rhodanobacter sp. KK11]MDW2983023.1 hypothetical protein [Rhodanobacter sp. KK11]